MKVKQSIFLAVISTFLFSCEPTMERDGGVRIILEANIEDLPKEEVDKNMEHLQTVLAQRLDLFGVLPKIQRDFKENRIIVEIPGKVDQERLRKLLQSSAKLEFWETEDNMEIGQKFTAIDDLLRKKLYPEFNDSVIQEAQADTARMQANSLDKQLEEQNSQQRMNEETMRKRNPLYSYLRPAFVVNERNEPVNYQQGPVVGYVAVADTARVGEYLRMPEVKSLLSDGVKFLWSFKPMEGEVFSLVAIRTNRANKAPLSGSMVTDARVLDDPSYPQVSITMTPEAAIAWKNLTRDNIGRSIAIVIDDQVYSYPIVQSEIVGGVSSITGSFTRLEADDFANVLKAGSLPLRTRIVQEDMVKPQSGN